MRYFLCLLRPNGEPADESLRLQYTPRSGRWIEARSSWVAAGSFAAITGAVDGHLGPAISRRGSLIGVGDVRLDNYNEVAQWTRSPVGVPDLQLVLAALEQRGPECVKDLLGDFAFVVWDEVRRELLAARDAFGVRGLHFVESCNVVALSSRASLLARTDEYSLDFIADALIGGSNCDELTPFAGVTTLPSGSLLLRYGRSSRVTKHWTPDTFSPNLTPDVGTHTETFRDLFATSIRQRLLGPGRVWAQLSGGLDSSAVVCMAQTLAQEGSTPAPLAGTITFVDSLGKGDERPFVDAVVRQYNVPNEQVMDYWMWQDDGQSPPFTEAPGGLYPLYARDRRCCEIIRRAGGCILLTGVGSDHYLSCLPYHIADWIARGNMSAACHELTRWAVLNRTSFWQELFRSAIRPLLPKPLRHITRPRTNRVPAWVEPRFARATALHKRWPDRKSLDGRPGAKYAGAIADQIGHFGRHSDRTVFDDLLEVRHPFLYRPLVEFSLRLAPELRTQPHEQKWILRQAMNGILPEAVRTRTGKGGIDSRLAWSLIHEQNRINDLLRDPLLSQLGCVNARKLKAAVDAIRSGQESAVISVIETLALETWLRVRSNRWTVRESIPPRTVQFANPVV
jgi:asparagine synthase (glutamine-hydrolysing)